MSERREHMATSNRSQSRHPAGPDGPPATPALWDLTALEKAILGLCAIAILGLAAMTVRRGAFLHRPLTDAQVFFRAAWALPNDVSIFEVTDDNGWHYLYPPTLAILLRPFAHAPAGEADLRWSLPYPLSLALWFVVGFGALLAAVVWFGRALDDHVLTPRPPAGFFHPWWLLRVGPLLAFMCVAGSSLGRGQVTTLLLLSMVGFAVSYAAGRPLRAGLWLALGITLKVFPGIMALLPLLRRDGRCLAGIVLGSTIGLFVIPALSLGPAETVSLYGQWVHQRLGGMATGGVEEGLSAELSPLPPDMVGFGPVLLRLANLFFGTQFTRLTTWIQALHWTCSLALLGAVVWACRGRAWTRASPQPRHGKDLLFASALIASACVPMIPVAQAHYWTFAVPLFMCGIAFRWRERGRSGLLHGATLFGCLVWAGFMVTELRDMRILSGIGWLTLLMTGFILHAAWRLRKIGTGL